MDFIQFARSNYGVPNIAPLTDAQRANMAFGDFDPSTFPGLSGDTEIEAGGQGITKVSDFIEDFSYAASDRSGIDNLPFGSLLWWDMDLDGMASLERVKQYYNDLLTSVEDISVFANNFGLKAYPNPLQEITRIEFELPQAATVRIRILDAMGRTVTRLVDRSLPSGTHQFDWNASNQPSGIYYYVITLDGRTATGKLLRN